MLIALDSVNFDDTKKVRLFMALNGNCSFLSITSLRTLMALEVIGDKIQTAFQYATK